MAEPDVQPDLSKINALPATPTDTKSPRVWQDDAVEPRAKEMPVGNIHLQKVKESKAKSLCSAANLPAEVIEHILYLTDPETFASLVVLDRAWRSASQSSQLYAHHLARCPSFPASNTIIHEPFTEESLPKLKSLFVQEVKRNLFEVYLRPRQTNVNIISTTTSSSAAFPGGEAYDFAFSPRGKWCLALSSSRILVIDTASAPISVKRELKVLRRPLSAMILDNGSILAVLSTNHNVNLYDLSEAMPRLKRSLTLDNPSHNIAMSARGEVLAAAYDAGVEIHSLAEHAIVSDRRVVKCDRVDALAFSTDGTMLLGTTQTSKNPSTVILSAPYFTETDHDMPMSELICHMWTSQIIFPNSSRDCSHATLLPRQADGDASWTLTYDRVFESFRAVRTDDLRNGTTYFTGPNPMKERQRRRAQTNLTPSTLPSTTQNGDLVAAGFLGSEVWLYGVPEGLDVPRLLNLDDHSQSSLNAGPSTTMADPRGPNATEQLLQGVNAELERLPRWQLLVDKYRNVFAKGRRVAKVPGVSGMSWVSYHDNNSESRYITERLILAAPGGVSGSSDLEQEEMASADGGRLVILDFDWSTRDGQCEEMTIEVGNADPQLLEEENMDMATEIAIVRRRTVARRDGVTSASVADVLRPPGEDGIPPVPAIPFMPSGAVGFGLDGISNPEPAIPEPVSPASSSEEGVTLEEAADALDGPYSHTNPRSRNTLYRSATAVEASRRRAPAPLPNSGRIEYRRTDGTELPHESDADNWVPPPPPYTSSITESEDRLQRHLAMITQRPVQNSSSLPLSTAARLPVRAQTTREASFPVEPVRRRNSADLDLIPQIPRKPLVPNQYGRAPPPLSSESSREMDDVISPLSRRTTTDSSANTLSPITPLRRPLSGVGAFGSRSAALRGRNVVRGAQPGVAVPESAKSTSPSPPSSSSPEPALSTVPLSLSGTNLQHRLEYPLPPPPRNARINGPSLSDLPALVRAAESPRSNTPTRRPMMASFLSSPSIPAADRPSTNRDSAYQLNNYHNHSIAELASTPATQYPIRRDSANVSGFSSRSASRQAGVTGPVELPHNTAAVSRFRSPFRRNLDNPSRSLSRSGSRNNRVLTASTPNLRHPHGQRLNSHPNIAANRLSHMAPEVVIGSYNPARDMVHGGYALALPKTSPEQDRRGFGRRISRVRTMSEDPGHAASAGGRGRRQRLRNGAGADGEIWEGHPGTREVEQAPQGRKGKGAKCIVM